MKVGLLMKRTMATFAHFTVKHKLMADGQLLLMLIWTANTSLVK